MRKRSKMSGLSVNGFISFRGESIFTKIIMAKESIVCAYQRVRYGFCDRDMWNIDIWFNHVMKGLLTYYRDHRHGSPELTDEEFAETGAEMPDDPSDTHKRWTAVVNRMIFLLGEMSEETCTKKNPYEAEYDKASDAFAKQYGFWGKGLVTPEEQAESEKKGTVPMHFMDELPEYAPISVMK